MKKKELLAKIEELERRINVLESRPVYYTVRPIQGRYQEVLPKPYKQPYDPNATAPSNPDITYPIITCETYVYSYEMGDSFASPFQIETSDGIIKAGHG